MAYRLIRGTSTLRFQELYLWFCGIHVEVKPYVRLPTWNLDAKGSKRASQRSNKTTIYVLQLRSSLGELADEVIAPVFGKTVAPITCPET
jgi:hypothetical protein